jgi:hypothetical protein
MCPHAVGFRTLADKPAATSTIPNFEALLRKTIHSSRSVFTLPFSCSPLRIPPSSGTQLTVAMVPQASVHDVPESISRGTEAPILVNPRRLRRIVDELVSCFVSEPTYLFKVSGLPTGEVSDGPVKLRSFLPFAVL